MDTNTEKKIIETECKLKCLFNEKFLEFFSSFPTPTKHIVLLFSLGFILWEFILVVSVWFVPVNFVFAFIEAHIFVLFCPP